MQYLSTRYKSIRYKERLAEVGIEPIGNIPAVELERLTQERQGLPALGIGLT